MVILAWATTIGTLISAVSAVGEEIGWRGYMPCLCAEDAAGSALASVTMADGDTNRLSEDLRPELATTARCKPKCHRSPM